MRSSRQLPSRTWSPPLWKAASNCRCRPVDGVNPSWSGAAAPVAQQSECLCCPWCAGSDRIVTWGEPNLVVELVVSCTRRGGGGNIPPKSPREAFCQTPTWGMSNCGGDSTAVQRSTDSCNMQCFCCDLGRWNCGDMGRSKLWWG